MKTGVNVSDAMTNKPVTLLATSSVEECSRIMAVKHVGSIIVESEGELVGIVTEQDIVRKAVASNLNAADTPLKAVMSKIKHTITPDKDVFDALKKMGDKNVRHLPVTDKKGKLVGYITGKDILKLQPQLFDILAEKIELREQERKINYMNL